MSLQEIQSLLLEVLREVQTVSGRAWAGLDLSAKPIGGLDGFDSLSGVEATAIVEQKLGCRNLAINSIFVADDKKRALTVREIAQNIANKVANGGGKV